jgi:hypothetical protein
MGINDHLEKFGLFAVVNSSDIVKLVHHCGEPLVKNGQRTLKGREKIHQYYCPTCDEEVDPSDYYRRWPREVERDRMELIQEILNGEFSLGDSG